MIMRNSEWPPRGDGASPRDPFPLERLNAIAMVVLASSLLLGVLLVSAAAVLRLAGVFPLGVHP